MSHNAPLLRMGQTDAMTADTYLGREFEFDDIDLDNDGKRRSELPKRMRIVRNDSGGALNPREAVVFTSGSKTSVTKKTDAADLHIGGFVDEWVDSVPDGSIFLITVYGPSTVIAHGALSKDDRLVSQAAGRVDSLDNAIEEAGSSDSGAKELANAQRVLDAAAMAMEAASSQDDTPLAFVDIRF